MQVVNEEVDNFLDSLKSTRTKEVYAAHRKQFLAFTGRTSINEDNASEATAEIVRYLKRLKDEGLSYSHRGITLAAIKHDYTMQDKLVLNWTKIAKFLGENERKYEIRGYTHDEIRKLLEVADIKYRAIILMFASTGMRRNALVKIESKDMEYLKDYQLYEIKIYKKSKSEQICFTTPEAAEAIKLYVSKRPGAKYFHNVENKTVSKMLVNLATRAGLISKKGLDTRHRNEIPAVHGLRKFCITQMAKAKVDTEVAKLLTGHSIGVRRSYLDYSEDDLLQEYLKAVDLLTINEANRLRLTIDRANRQKSELDDYKNVQEKEIQDLRKEKDKQIQDLESLRDELREQKATFEQATTKLREEINSLRKGAEWVGNNFTFVPKDALEKRAAKEGKKVYYYDRPGHRISKEEADRISHYKVIG